MVSALEIRRASFKYLIAIFFLNIILCLSLNGQSKIVISQFKNSHTKDIALLYKKIADCNTLNCAYQILVSYFIEANGDFFELKCIKGCTPPLVMQFGKQSKPENKVTEKMGFNTTKNLKSPLFNQALSLSFLVEDTYIDSLKSKPKDSIENLMARLFQTNLSKNFTAKLKSSLFENYIGMPDDSLWKSSSYFTKEQKYLAVIKPLSYLEKTRNTILGLGDFGEYNYALDVIDLETGIISARDTFVTKENNRGGFWSVAGIFPKTNKIDDLKYRIGETSKSTVLRYLDSLLFARDSQYFKNEYLKINESELQFDSLIIEEGFVVTELQNLQPVVSVQKKGTTLFTVGYYCTLTCLLEFIKHCHFANTYRITQKNNKIILTLKE